MFEKLFGTKRKQDYPEGDDWERKSLQQLAFASLEEQRKTRRWNLFFKFFFAGYLLLLIVLANLSPATDKRPSGDFTALIDLEGVIAPDKPASADNLVGALRDAFDSRAKAVIIRANSPGGATVQSAYVRDEIVRLRKKYENKKLYAVVSDVCASGCYYIISAADRIYANKSSLIGSIGVIIDAGFGFSEAMKKVGVERRVFTAGEHKAMLDPFMPLNASDRVHVKKMLLSVHDEFVAVVKEGRGKSLKDDPTLYSGRFWEGKTARALGLVDEFGSAGYVAREIIGADKLVDFTRQQHWLDRFAGSLGTSIGNAIASRLNDSAVQPVR
jgi:protease-4